MGGPQENCPQQKPRRQRGAGALCRKSALILLGRAGPGPLRLGSVAVQNLDWGPGGGSLTAIRLEDGAVTVSEIAVIVALWLGHGLVSFSFWRCVIGMAILVLAPLVVLTPCSHICVCISIEFLYSSYAASSIELCIAWVTMPPLVLVSPLPPCLAV